MKSADGVHPAFAPLLTQAQNNAARVVLPEGEDPRIVAAAVRACADGIAQPVLLGNTAQVQQLMLAAQDEIAAADSATTAQAKTPLPEIIDPAAYPQRQQLIDALVEWRGHKGMDAAKADKTLEDSLTLAAMLLATDTVAGCVAGAVYPTADVVRTALQLIGKRDGFSFASSFFLMLMTQPHHPRQDAMLFADCALNVDPDAEQLAEIAVQTGESAKQLLSIEPEIAMLSFSTNGSARHPKIEKVRSATASARERRPDWRIIGDVQLDAAMIPDILAAKAPEMATDAPANILVFPDLDSGNIGYKLCERFGGCEAIGPVLQGLAKPVNDLSRGCKTEDIYKILAVTSVQAG